MAFYIGIRSGSISVNSNTYLTADSGGTYKINTYCTKLDIAVWRHNGVGYDVYAYTNTNINSLLSNNNCFIHNGGSSITAKRYLSDSEVYVEEYTTATFPGSGSYGSGTIYLFSAAKQQVRNNKWCYTSIEKYETNVGSSNGRMYVNTSKTPSGIDTAINMGMSDSGGTRIIEFYNSSAVSGISVGLARSSTATSLVDSDSYNYAVFSRGTGWSKTPSWGSSGRQVIAVHNTYYNGSYVTPLYAFYKGSTSSSVPDGNRTEYGYSKGSSTSWAKHIGGDECIYLSICPTGGSTTSYSTSFSVTANKTYNFSIHLRGRTDCGIVLSATSLSSPNLSSSGFYRKACLGTGTDAYGSIDYTPTSTGYVYVYFVRGASNTTPYPFADIMVTPHCSITLNSNGGSGGLSGTSCVPDSNPSELSSLPSRSGFTFMGYYTTRSSGGTQYFDASGTATRTVSGDITLYARWENEVIYNPSNVNAYCTSDVSAATSTVSSQNVTVSNIAWTCGSGATPTYNGISQITRPNGIVSSTGWELSDNGRKLTIPSGIQNGEYSIEIGLISPGGSNYVSNGGIGFNIHVSIISTTLTYGPVELIQHTPDDIIEGNITQQKNFPAGQFTISTDNIGEYFTVYGVFHQVVSCNNGRVREGNLNVYGWLPGINFSNIVVPSLGTTQTNTTTYTFANNDNEALYYGVEGEGYKSFVKYVRSGVREANSVTSLSASVGESSIYAGDKTFIKTKALFTSGDKVSVRGTYSGYDSSIINVDNNVTVIYVENISDEDDFALEYSRIYYYYGQYNGNYLFKKMYGDKLAAEYIVTDSNDFDVLLHASYEYNGHFTTPTHIVGRLNEDMSDYGYVDEVRIIDVY